MGLGYLRKTALRRRPSPLERVVCALLAALALAVLPAQARAQVISDSETVDSRAILLEQGTMAKVTDLDFGYIAMPSTAGTISLTPAASPVCTASFGLVRSGPCVAAQFAVRGRKNWLVRIRNMTGTVVLDGPGSATMNVTLNHGVADMVAAPGGPSPPGTFGRWRITSDNGYGTFFVGGTLNVANGQAAGVYIGTFEIQVLFN